MTIARLEYFVVDHVMSPVRGVSIAYGGTHPYVLVKLTDSDGVVGWGETYYVSGTAGVVDDVASLILGRDPERAAELWSHVWQAAEHPYAASALSIAVDDLRARRRNVSIATLHGGPRRDRVRAYGASGGYVEGEDPAISWPREADEIMAAGYTALKMRIGRYPIGHEVPIIEAIRARLPPATIFTADGNGGFTLPRAIEMGRELDRLGFTWWEEPLPQWGGYAGYERLTRALDIAVAGGEVLMSRHAAREFLARGAADIIQPEPVICGGIAETLFYAELARLRGVRCIPHTSGSAIGIAAALQVVACLPDATRSPAGDEVLIEIGVDPCPWRDELLAEPFSLTDGDVHIPTGPGLGVHVDEGFVRRRAQTSRVFEA